MNKIELLKDIEIINKELSFDLWNICFFKDKPRGLSPRLIFPMKRDEVKRISEQESKLLYGSILNRTNYYYSIETPTKGSYSFSGSKSISARSDLSLYCIENNTLTKIANVELKFGMVEDNLIKKDIEKLIRENIVGNWFHTIKNINLGTIGKIFEKFKISFIEKEHLLNKIDEIEILFCFCVLEKRISLIKIFKYNKGDDFKKYVNDFFIIKYNIERKVIKITEDCGWLTCT